MCHSRHFGAEDRQDVDQESDPKLSLEKDGKGYCTVK